MKLLFALIPSLLVLSACAQFTTQPALPRPKLFQWTVEIARRMPDADARSFVRRSGITDDSERKAAADLVRDLKKAGVWKKLYAFYPFIGGTGESCSHNLISARYQITWSGGVIFNRGVRSDGTGYGNTGFNPRTAGVARDSFHLFTWAATTSPSPGGEALAVTAGGYSSSLAVTLSGFVALDLNSNTGNGAFTPQTFGNALAQRVNDPSFDDPRLLLFAQVNGSFFENWVPATETPEVPNGNFYVLARNQNGTPTGFLPHTLRAAAFGKTLSAAEVQAYFAAVTKFQTAVNRAGNL